MALFEVMLRQLYDSKPCINRWNYVSSGTPASVALSFGLLSAFGGIPAPITSEFPDDSVMASLANLQNLDTRFVELVVENLYDPLDFYTVPYAPEQKGLTSGEPMSRFLAYGFQSNRVRTDIRRGNKRFVGCSETYVGDKGVITSTGVDAMTPVAVAMSEVLEYDDEGNTLTYTPVVLSLEKHDPDAEHDDFWYKKYATLALQLDHTAVGITWTPKPSATTQNTRK